jgi:hypothetical protein
MKLSWHKPLALFSLAAVLVGFSACSDATDPITNKIDCSSVCNRYKDCFDSNYDVDACKSKCEDDAEDSDKRQDKLDACDDCIDDESCSSATFKCAADCVGIVP